MRSISNQYRTVVESDVKTTLNKTTDDGLIVLVFTADWSGISQILDDYYRELAYSYGSYVKFLRINVDKSKAFANSYNVHSIPTTVIFQNKEIVYRFEGALPKSVIASKLNEFVK